MDKSGWPSATRFCPPGQRLCDHQESIISNVSEIAPKFDSPEEEIAFLRGQIAEKERALLARAPEADQAELESAAKEALHEYGTFTPNVVLDKEHELSGPALSSEVATVETATEPTEEIVRIATDQGIRNALTVLEKSKNAHMTDDVHAKLIELIREGGAGAGT